MSEDFTTQTIQRLGIVERQLDQAMTNEAYRVSVSTANVSNPPTDAELDTAFGQPATLGPGFLGFVDDNNAQANFWFVATCSSRWIYVAMTMAV